MKLSNFSKVIDINTFKPMLICTCTLDLEVIQDNKTLMKKEELELMFGKMFLAELEKQI